ncbi:hypothetical protein [Streptomyces sp. MN6]
MYHHPPRRCLTTVVAERRARRLLLTRLAREHAGQSVQSRDQHSRFGPIAKAARQNGGPSIPFQPTVWPATVRFPRQRTSDGEGSRDA